ncbi:MAG: CPXCG motif-containing cysteine-rich protein [Myxococcota bacterium]
MLAEDAEFICGYCGEASGIAVDPTGGEEQSYVEDCPVCCRPNRVFVRVDGASGAILEVSVAYEG